MALNDIYQATFEQRRENEPCLNIFHYLRNNDDGTAEDLAGELIDGPISLINDLQCLDMVNRSLEVVNLGNLSDFYQASVSGTGGAGADCMPVELALNISLRLNTRGVRPGSKRISGITRGHVADNGDIVGTISTPLALLLTALATPLTGDISGVTYTPIVIARVKEPATADHGEYYRLPETDAELALKGYGIVTVALHSARISHQVSRGNGK